MAFTDPNAYVLIVRDAIRDIFRSNKAALNTNLTKGTFSLTHNDQIVAGDPRKASPPASLYPMIMIKVVTEDEQFEFLGERKRPIVTYRIFAITMDETGQQDDEIVYLTRNLKGILRNNMRFNLSDVYVIKSNPGRTNYGIGFEEPSVFSDISETDIDVEMEVS